MFPSPQSRRSIDRVFADGDTALFDLGDRFEFLELDDEPTPHYRRSRRSSRRPRSLALSGDNFSFELEFGSRRSELRSTPIRDSIFSPVSRRHSGFDFDRDTDRSRRRNYDDRSWGYIADGYGGRRGSSRVRISESIEEEIIYGTLRQGYLDEYRESENRSDRPRSTRFESFREEDAVTYRGHGHLDNFSSPPSEHLGRRPRSSSCYHSSDDEAMIHPSNGGRFDSSRGDRRRSRRRDERRRSRRVHFEDDI